jgi:integrase
MAKRSGKAANGAGSVYRTKDGTWKACVTVRNLDGTSKRIVRNAPSQRAALVKLDELRSEFRDLSDNPGTITVRELVERWLISFEGEVSTLDGYQNLLDRHIGPHIGERLLSGLTSLEVQDWVQSLRADQTGARTIQMAYSLLKRSCQWGVTIRLLARNPCEGIKRPAAKREAIRPFSLAEVGQILQESRGHRLHALFVLAITTGMRQGELFGLQWPDVDLDRRTISIVRQAKDYRGIVTLKAPKTAAGIRTISITDIACAALAARRVLAETEGHDSLQVFTSPKGMFLRRTLFGRRTWKPLLSRLKLEHRGAHHLRHTAATMMLGAAVPPHIVAGVLGHETAETVMKVYAHYITKDSRVASDAMAGLLSGSYQTKTGTPPV